MVRRNCTSFGNNNPKYLQICVRLTIYVQFMAIIHLLIQKCLGGSFFFWTHGTYSLQTDIAVDMDNNQRFITVNTGILKRNCYYAPPHRAEALSDDAPLTSVWRLSVAYIGPKSRTERPRNTKIGTEVAHVIHDSDITFKVKRSKVNLQGWGILWRPPAQLVLT